MNNIAFWSPTPQQGKTTAGRFLADNYDYVRVSFADPLRKMLERLLSSVGLSKLEVSYFMNEGKEQEIPVIGTSFRQLARTLGTEWGRDCIDQSLWVNVFASKVKRLHSPVCVDDLRFPNELEALRGMGFVLVRIQRDNLRVDSHRSDTALRDFDEWDHVIVNNGTLEQLCSEVRRVAFGTV